jgi:hypothetical protein
MEPGPVIPVSLPQPIGTQPRHFTWLSVAICILAAALLAAKLHDRMDMSWPSLFARSHEAVSVSVGPASFRLPAAYIATAHQRSRSYLGNARFETLRLAMHWPDLTATSSSGDGAIVVELASNSGRESLRARLEPFYRRLARGGELSGPDGLRMLTLSARRSPDTDLIVFDPAVRNGFIARCRRDASSGSAVCHRAITDTAGLELRYRFDQSLLPDWRRIDRDVAAKVRGFRVR